MKKSMLLLSGIPLGLFEYGDIHVMFGCFVMLTGEDTVNHVNVRTIIVGLCFQNIPGDSGDAFVVNT